MARHKTQLLPDCVRMDCHHEKASCPFQPLAASRELQYVSQHLDNLWISHENPPGTKLAEIMPKNITDWACLTRGTKAL